MDCPTKCVFTHTSHKLIVMVLVLMPSNSVETLQRQSNPVGVGVEDGVEDFRSMVGVEVPHQRPKEWIG